MKRDLKMTEYENKIRFQWLIITICNALLPLFVLTSIICWGFINDIEITSPYMVILLAAVVIMPLSTYVGIHCAYRKFGTVYLMLCLIFSPFSFFYNSIRDWYSLPTLTDEQFPSSLRILLTCLFILSILLFIAWYYLSYKLRQVNKQIQKRKILESEEFQNASIIIRDASDLDDLNHKFHNIISDPSPGAWVDELSMVYNERKTSLENTTSA
ncbi:MAG: hypothetical protein WC222_10335 [Parachlamydiales bacterium]